jgi:hypothetical protein
MTERRAVAAKLIFSPATKNLTIHHRIKLLKANEVIESFFFFSQFLAYKITSIM